MDYFLIDYLFAGKLNARQYEPYGRMEP